MRHVMLDLETWGTRPGSALRSIGAVAFELQGGVGDTFYANIDDASCLAAGLEVDRATQEWWEKQPLEARAHLKIDQVPLADVVTNFHAWFRLQGAQCIWSQGGNFDEPLWSAAARKVWAQVPWQYWNARCTRTLYAAARFDPRSIARVGTHHNALDDALHQVRCVQESYKRIQQRDAA